VADSTKKRGGWDSNRGLKQKGSEWVRKRTTCRDIISRDHQLGWAEQMGKMHVGGGGGGA